MRYAERGWTNNGSQEEGEEEGNQEESHQEEVAFYTSRPAEWGPPGGQGVPRRIYLTGYKRGSMDVELTICHAILNPNMEGGDV